MTEYWESRYMSEGAMWKFEPSDSALMALEIFKSNGINHILIPGCGYGRNAKVFHDTGFRLTGIEISQSAIDIAKANGMDFPIFHGSVTSMPYNDEKYDGIFCYALIHLLNATERRKFLRNCFQQLNSSGFMIFTVISKLSDMYNIGKLISKDRMLMTNGLKVFFYNAESVRKEFSEAGLTEFREIDEPIKFMEGEKPMKCIFIVCRKKA